MSSRTLTTELLDPPGRPSRPDVELAADTEVLVTWEPPEIATFIEGIVYRLECRLAGENDHFAPFTVISDHIEDEAVVVKVRGFLSP